MRYSEINKSVFTVYYTEQDCEIADKISCSIEGMLKCLRQNYKLKQPYELIWKAINNITPEIISGVILF